jgi:GH24 family phage-related lysozyme (muramidase)
MKKTEKLLLTLALPSGVFLFFAYWLYLRISDAESAPSIGELWDSVQSYGVRGYLIMRGKVEQALTLAGSTPDARTIAAGLIAQEEGFSSRRYPDPAGQTKTYSIGYGHQILDGEPYDENYVMSEPEGFQLLLTDLAKYADYVDSQVQADLTPNQFAALYSFCYNEGEGHFGSSSLLRFINSGDLVSASNEFSRWVYAGGVINSALVSRRADEQQLFSSDLTA